MLTDFPHEAVDALLALTGPGADPPQILVEVRQMGGAVGRREDQESAFCARDTAYSLLTVGLAGTPGVRSAATTPSASWPSAECWSPERGTEWRGSKGRAPHPPRMIPKAAVGGLMGLRICQETP